MPGSTFAANLITRLNSGKELFKGTTKISVKHSVSNICSRVMFSCAEKQHIDLEPAGVMKFSVATKPLRWRTRCTKVHKLVGEFGQQRRCAPFVVSPVVWLESTRSSSM